MAEYFHHLTNYPRVPDSYLDEALAQEYLTQADHKRVTKLIMSNPKKALAFSNTKFFKDLKKKFPGAYNPVVLRVNPNTLYDWHIDKGDINCGINILLNNKADSFTLFRTSTDEVKHYNVINCDYIPFVPTVFNSTAEHCVINLSNEYRYLLKVPIKYAEYRELKHYLLDYKFDSNEY
jgi:hypothetical protein